MMRYPADKMATEEYERRLVEFEERAASLYMQLARRFRRDKDLSSFWLEMSKGEREHASLLEFCGCEEIIKGNLPERNAIRRLSDLFSRLERRASRRDLSEDDAFLIAAELVNAKRSLSLFLCVLVKGQRIVSVGPIHLPIQILHELLHRGMELFAERAFVIRVFD